MKEDVYIRFNESDYEVLILVGEKPLNPENDNTDVTVKFVSGESYSATFFTLENIKSLFDKNKQTGECDSGIYFYCVDMIIVEKLSPEIILQTVRNLVQNGELKNAFSSPETI